MTAIWVMVLLFGPAQLFWMIVTCMAVFGLYEYFKMTCKVPVAGKMFFLVAIALLPVLSVVMNDSGLFMLSLFLSLLGTVLLSIESYGKLGNTLHFLSISSFGALYISFCLAHLVFIRFLPQGIAWLLVMTAVTAGSDTGAYYLGKAYGRRKLCPHISPGKTVEGAMGGVTVGTLAAFAVGMLLLPEFNPLFLLTTSLTLSLVSIIGDLVESIVKRSAGVKDSGTLLFGHGGVLDRIDSMLIAAPLLYYIINIDVLI